MAKINIKLLVGPTQGRIVSLDQSTVSFGRSEDCQIVIPLDYVSRRHGQLNCLNNQWTFTNHSAHATYINKQKAPTPGSPAPGSAPGVAPGVAPKSRAVPIAVYDGDLVYVGKEPMFQVLIPSQATQTADYATAHASTANALAEQTSRKSTSKQKMIWIAVAAYLLLMATVFVVLTMTLDKKKAGGNALTNLAVLTDAQIQAAITRPVAARQPDPLRAAQALDAATQHYFQRDGVNPSSLYHAYHQYQLALAWSGKLRFASANDVLRHQEVQNSLVTQVTQRYHDAAAKLRSSQFREADDAFWTLIKMYPDDTSPLFHNLEQQRHAAKESYKRLRSSRTKRFNPG